MSIRIHIPTPMRQHTEGQAVVETAGATVKGLLDSLGQRHPAITGRLFDSNGTTLLKSVQATYNNIISGGIAFRAANEGYFDTVTMTHSVSPNSGRPGGGGCPTAPGRPAEALPGRPERDGCRRGSGRPSQR